MEKGLPTAIAFSASESVPPIKGAKPHGRVVHHHSPTEMQAGQMVPNTQHLIHKDYYQQVGFELVTIYLGEFHPHGLTPLAI